MLLFSYDLDAKHYMDLNFFSQSQCLMSGVSFKVVNHFLIVWR